MYNIVDKEVVYHFFLEIFFCLFCFGFWVPCFFQHFCSDLDIIRTIFANWNIAAVCWNIFFLWNFSALSFALQDLGCGTSNFFFAGCVFWVLCSRDKWWRTPQIASMKPSFRISLPYLRQTHVCGRWSAKNSLVCDDWHISGTQNTSHVLEHV